jgi:hypothetical protein
VAKIHFRYQSVIKGAEVTVKLAVNLAVFAMLVLYSSLRYAAPPSKQIRSCNADVQIGNRFLAAEMKEYDA